MTTDLRDFPFPIDDDDSQAIGDAAPKSDKGNGPDRESFPLSDTGNAEMFASLFGTMLRFDHLKQRRLTFGPHRWMEDRDGHWLRLGIEAARRRYLSAIEAPDDQKKKIARHALKSESRNAITAMLKIAEALPPIAESGENWDANPWLLGVPNGVVDLETGTLREGLPEDRITMSASVPFDPGACCPRWMQFLDEIFRGDLALIDYIWRAVGYSLTGLTFEQVIFICYGMGANGKTVFLNVLRRILGDYAYNTPFSTFELYQRGTIPSDLAALAGRRLVTASETGEASRLNEQRVKALTGGDPITARAMYQDFFTYMPAMKICLLVNHKPRVADDSFGFWRRVRLIPFTRQFTNDADRHLEEKLMAEASGILTWAVLGCLEWQGRGLEPPEAVTTATDDYRQEADLLGDFIASCCETGAEFDAPAGALYRAYRKWAEQMGMKERETLSSTSFGRRMGAKFRKERCATGNVYLGVGVKLGFL